jgi:hypothetical protein
MKIYYWKRKRIFFHWFLINIAIMKLIWTVHSINIYFVDTFIECSNSPVISPYLTLFCICRSSWKSQVEAKIKNTNVCKNCSNYFVSCEDFKFLSYFYFNLYIFWEFTSFATMLLINSFSKKIVVWCTHQILNMELRKIWNSCDTGSCYNVAECSQNEWKVVRLKDDQNQSSVT